MVTVASVRLPASSFQLSVSSFQFPVSSFRLPFARFVLEAGRWELEAITGSYRIITSYAYLDRGRPCGPSAEGTPLRDAGPAGARPGRPRHLLGPAVRLPAEL